MKQNQKRKSKTVLKVPYFSQNSSNIPKEWRRAACGIVVVKMILAYFFNKSPSISSLIDEGVVIGGFTTKNWTHESLVRLLRNHGVTAYTQEFKSANIKIDKTHNVIKMFYRNEPSLLKKGITKIQNKLSDGLPVIVSVEANFRNNKHTHLILLVGYDKNEELLYFSDPDEKNNSEFKLLKIKTGDFLKYWRRSAIFLD